MTARKLTGEMETRIREGHAAGESLNSIARALEVNPATVSRWAKREGLLWTGVPYAATVVKERIAFNRLKLAEAALADALAIRERLWAEHTVLVNTPEGPQQVVMEIPDAKAVADYSKAIERLAKSHELLSGMTDATGVEHAKSVLTQMQDVLVGLVAGSAEEDLASLEPPGAAEMAAWRQASSGGGAS